MLRKLTLTVVLLLALGSATGQTAYAAKANTASKGSRITAHDRQVILFFHNHPKLAATPEGRKVLVKILPHVIRSLQAKMMERIEQARIAAQWPAHHQLWECIHGHEAGSWYDHDSGGNGHYGGLQMSWNWLGYISGDAGNYSQLDQEKAAERAYAHSGYSTSFLYGQWFDYEYGGSACLQYA